MCRWFAYISPKEPALLEDVLITPKHALTKQINERYLPGLGTVRNSKYEGDPEYHPVTGKGDQLFNMDGIGIAWYVPTRSQFTSNTNTLLPALYKSPNPASNDFNLGHLCANTASRCVMAHIRAGSESAVASINNHPFMFGRYVFMHNGVINQFAKIRRRVAESLPQAVYENIHGSTDSEHAAALFISNLFGPTGTVEDWTLVDKSLEDLKAAMVKTVVDIHRFQFEKANEDPAFKANQRGNGLNFCVTDGKDLVAIRFCNSWIEYPAALYFSTTAGALLHKRRRKLRQEAIHNGNPEIDGIFPNHLCVASEPTTYNLLADGTPDMDNPDWTLIVPNTMVTMSESGNVRKDVTIDFPKEYMLNRGVAP